jgi:hypothetical protein
MVKECQHKINNEIYIQKSKRGNSLEDAKMRSQGMTEDDIEKFHYDVMIE